MPCSTRSDHGTPAEMRTKFANRWRAENNGPGAHQAVFHVHFHIIPKFRDGKGLGIGWKPGSLDSAQGKTLALAIAGKL